MIATYAENDSLPGNHLPGGIDHRLLDNCSDRDNHRLWRVDNRIKLFHPVGTEIGNGYRTALVFFRFKLFGSGAGRQILDGSTDLSDGLFLCFTNYWSDQAFVYGDRTRQLDIGKLD